MEGLLDLIKQTEKHVHMYRKFKTDKGKTLWRCILPACSHSFYGDEHIAGREALCNSCHKVFNIRRDDLRRLPIKPVCETCTKKRGEKYRPDRRELTLEEKLARLESLPE